MGILSRLLGLRPGQDEWPGITEYIAQQIEFTRGVEFEGLVADLRDLIGSWGIGETVVNAHLGGRAESAMIAFQLLIVGSYMAQQRYVPLSRASDFMDLLCSQVRGARLGDARHFFHRYKTAAEEDDEGAAARQLVIDVYGYIVGAQPGTARYFPRYDVQIVLFSSMWSFSLVTCVPVAAGFRDGAALAQLKQQLQSPRT